MKRKRKAGVEAAIKEYYARFDSIFGDGFSRSPGGRRLTAKIAGPLGEGQLISVVKEEPRWATVYIEGTAVAAIFIPNT